jgi:hypothetical protein
MKQTTTFGGCRVLNGRYALLECLVSSNIGQVYKGRDLQQMQSYGVESRILVHILPESCTTQPLDALFQQMLTAHQHLNVDSIMPPLAYGEADGERFMILQCPQAASVHPITDTSGHVTALPAQAKHTLKRLHKAGYVSKQLNPALLYLSITQQVHVLATALLPEIQAIPYRILGLSLRQRRLNFLLSCLGLSVFATVSAAAGSYLLHAEMDAAQANITTTVTDTQEEAAPAAPLQVAMINTEQAPKVYTDWSNSDRVTVAPVLMSALEVQPTPSVLSANPMRIPTSSTQKPTVQPAVLRPVPKAEKPQPKPDTKKDKAVKTEKSQLKSDTNKAQMTSPATTAPVAAALKTPSQDTNLETLAANAEQAIASDQLNKARQYIDAIRAQSHLHPYVKRLSNAIVGRYHSQVRNALQAGNADHAGDLLHTAKITIKEFNLTTANPAQELLEHQLAQFY